MSPISPPPSFSSFRLQYSHYCFRQQEKLPDLIIRVVSQHHLAICSYKCSVSIPWDALQVKETHHTECWWFVHTIIFMFGFVFTVPDSTWLLYITMRMLIGTRPPRPLENLSTECISQRPGRESAGWNPSKPRHLVSYTFFLIIQQ